ncbi:MAG: response regulator [Bacillota bacterium]
MAVRVMLVDDHTVVREGLKVLLESEEGIEIVGEADRGENVLEVAAATNPQVVIMDLRLQKMSGVEVTRILSEKFPDIKVIILSMYDEEDMVIQALKAGATGYVLKRAGVEELVKAIRLAARDETYLDPAIARRVVDSLQKENLSDKNRRLESGAELTPRENEILRLVAGGCTNAEIAGKLFISVKTVQAHRANLMQKLGIHDRVELVKYAIKKGLLSLEEEADR